MTPDVREEDTEAKQKTKQVTDDVQVFDNVNQIVLFYSKIPPCTLHRTKLVLREWIYFSLFSFQFFLPCSTLSIGLSSCTGDDKIAKTVPSLSLYCAHQFMFQGWKSGKLGYKLCFHETINMQITNTFTIYTYFYLKKDSLRTFDAYFELDNFLEQYCTQTL